MKDDGVEAELLDLAEQPLLLVGRDQLLAVDETLRLLTGRTCHATEATQRRTAVFEHAARGQRSAMRLRALIVALAVVAGCGGDDIGNELDRARDRADELRQDIEAQVQQARDEFRER